MNVSLPNSGAKPPFFARFFENLRRKFRDWRLFSNSGAKNVLLLAAKNISSSHVNVNSETVEALFSVHGRDFRIVMPREIPYTIYTGDLEISETLAAKINANAALEIKWFLLKQELAFKSPDNISV